MFGWARILPLSISTYNLHRHSSDDHMSLQDMHSFIVFYTRPTIYLFLCGWTQLYNCTKWPTLMHAWTHFCSPINSDFDYAYAIQKWPRIVLLLKEFSQNYSKHLQMKIRKEVPKDAWFRKNPQSPTSLSTSPGRIECSRSPARANDWSASRRSRKNRGLSSLRIIWSRLPKNGD